MDNNNYNNDFGDNQVNNSPFQSGNQNNQEPQNYDNMNNNYNSNNNGMNNVGNNFGNPNSNIGQQMGYNNMMNNQMNNRSAMNQGMNGNVPYNMMNDNGINSNHMNGNNAGFGQNNFINQQNNNNPYLTPIQQSENYNRDMHKKRSRESFGVKLGKYAAIAAIFGLISGTVFTGVNYIGSAASGTDSRVTLSTSGVTSDEKIKGTATGEAKDLVNVSGIVNEVMPSIVAITNTGTVTYQSFFGEEEYASQSCGTGVIVSQTKDYLYIATNNHVVADAKELTIQFSDEETVKAEIRGKDPADDLAVVQVKLKDIKKETLSKIKVATIGDSKKLNVGDSSIAIGNALGYGQSVTTGVISATGRTVTTQDETTGEKITNNNLIQTDAAINPGNSGGALLNSKGEVIGINSVKYSSTEVEGIGYAIPMAYAQPIIESLISDGEYVNTQTAYLGIKGGDVTSDVASTYKIPVGIYVSSVVKGCGAEKAGIQEGDIIVKFDGKKLTSMSELQAKLTEYKAGDKVKVVISRQNGNGYKEKEVEVTLSSAKDMK